MQKQHYKGKKVKYNVNERSPANAEELHLERKAAGELSHEHMMHKHRMHRKKMMGAKEVVLYAPVESTSAFSWHVQDPLLGDGVGMNQRLVRRAQVVANGFA